ncbi:AAA family ATPase [Romboutsia sp. Marseille-P6047]|uniref:AAA family ATPase n=1 Tax=Romboutsia sp. Marseille-P6047 TaxID=2161817 RepID=UPI000F050FBD|nr:AAA family ATPase [Romboutsia sp. Marseille-P6047]
MANYIDSIEIHNFKGIEDLILSDMKSINILIGDNNSGKTSVLEAISFLERPFDFSMHLKIAGRKYIQRGIRYNEIQGIFNDCDLEKEIDIIADTNNGSCKLNIKGEEELTSIEEGDYISIEQGPLYKFNLKYKFNDKMKKYSVESYKSNNLNLIRDKREFLNISYLVPIDTYVLGNLFKSLDSVIKKGQKEVLIDLLKLFDENIVDINFTSDKEIYITKKNKEIMNMSSFGDGLKKSIALISKLIEAQNGILLIDELETGIHKDLLGKVFKSIIKNIKKYNIQIIATTHSIEILEILLENLDENLDDIALYRLEEFRNKHYVRQFSGKDAYEIVIQGGGDLR